MARRRSLAEALALTPLLVLLAACGGAESENRPYAESDAEAAVSACGTGLFCAAGAIPGSSACMSGSTQIYCCPSGQTIVNGACSSSSVPACGTGLFCSAGSIPGASACMSGSTRIYCCPSGQTIVNGACSSSSVPACGTGLFCSAGSIPGSSACMSGSTRIYCCPSGQTIVNGACSSSSVPACGTGLFCSAGSIPGSSACMSGSTQIYCCPSGQTIVNGACSSSSVPACGTGLFCSAGSIPGASACMSGSTQIYCCPSGQTIVNGACSSSSTCNAITSLPSCNDAGCAWYACANACRERGTDICEVCPDYAGCGPSCASNTSLQSCDAAGCAWYACANACRERGTGLCQVCPDDPSCGPGCERFDGSSASCNADPACDYFTCSGQCWPAGTPSEVACSGCVRPRPGLVITQNTTLCPGTYRLDVPAGQAAVTVAASGVRLVCNGTVIESTAPMGPTDRPNVGIQVQGRNDVSIEGCAVHGFRYGVVVRDARNVTVDGVDADDNFTDPRAGWVQDSVQGGGLRLERVHGGLVRGSSFSRNWNGLELRSSSGVQVLDNVASHCSNTGATLVRSSDNLLSGNDFSFGIRGSGLAFPACAGCPLPNPAAWYGIDTRDSAGIILDAGSSRNQVLDNDLRYGGDGIFVRMVIEPVCAEDNYFARNDTRFSPHNAIESWCDGNQFLSNDASNSHYGIWLGATDRGLAMNNVVDRSIVDGISIQNGSDRHSRVVGNRVTNSGRVGILLSGRVYQAWESLSRWNDPSAGANPADPTSRIHNSSQILVQGNTVQGSGQHDVFVTWSRGVTLASNCTSGSVHVGAGTLLAPRVGGCGQASGPAPQPVLTVPGAPGAGTSITLDASGSRSPSGRTLSYSWLVQADFETISSGLPPAPLLSVSRGGPVQSVVFPAPGAYEVMVTVDDGAVAAQAYQRVVVGASCVCTGGTDVNGQPVSAACGASVCGLDRQLYACTGGTWVPTGVACGQEAAPPDACVVRVMMLEAPESACPEATPGQLAVLRQLYDGMQEVVEDQRRNLLAEARARVSFEADGSPLISVCLPDGSLFGGVASVSPAEPTTLPAGCRWVRARELRQVGANIGSRVPSEFIFAWSNLCTSLPLCATAQGQDRYFHFEASQAARAQIVSQIQARQYLDPGFYAEVALTYDTRLHPLLIEPLKDVGVFDYVTDELLDQWVTASFRCQVLNQCCEGVLCPIVAGILNDVYIRIASAYIAVTGSYPGGQPLSFEERLAAALLVASPALGYANAACSAGVSADCALNVFLASLELMPVGVEAFRASKSLQAAADVVPATRFGRVLPYVDEFAGSRGGLFAGLGDELTSPELANPLVRNHLEMFRNGGSKLVTKSYYDLFIEGAEYVGYNNELWLTTSKAMDDLLETTGGDYLLIKERLGTVHWPANPEPLYRIDVYNPLLHNGRLPTGLEDAANSAWLPGGYLPGGQPELVIDTLRIDPGLVRITAVGP